MKGSKRFIIGGFGALMPIFVTMLSIDLASVFSGAMEYTTGHVIGMVIRYSILFILGGFIAFLHEDETKLYKLFQIGIAAPALVTSFVTANGLSSAETAVPVAGVVRPAPVAEPQPSSVSFSLFASPAYAHPWGHGTESDGDLAEKGQSFELAGQMFNDIIQGITGSAYGRTQQKRLQEQRVVDTAPIGLPKPATEPKDVEKMKADIVGDAVTVRKAGKVVRAIPLSETPVAVPVVPVPPRLSAASVEKEEMPKEIESARRHVERMQRLYEEAKAELRVLEAGNVGAAY